MAYTNHLLNAMILQVGCRKGWELHTIGNLQPKSWHEPSNSRWTDAILNSFGRVFWNFLEVVKDKASARYYPGPVGKLLLAAVSFSNSGRILPSGHQTSHSPPTQLLVGGFNPFEKYESKWESSPNRAKLKNIWNHHPDCLLTTSHFSMP